MSIHHSRSRKLESERADRMFASKRLACLLYAPCLIPLAGAFLLLRLEITGPTTTVYIAMASLLGLVSGFLDMFRRKIIRQDEAIKELQEQLNQASSQSQQSPAGDAPKAAPEE